MEQGVCIVCKTPDPRLMEDYWGYFRISFSTVESALLGSITSEQKEAYKILKIIRETEIPDFILMGIVHIGDHLKKLFTSYHLKTVCLSLMFDSRNREAKSVREWLVLYLRELVSCLQKGSIQHHFITDLELLKTGFIKYDAEMFRMDQMSHHHITLEEFKKMVPQKYIFHGEELNMSYNTKCILEDVFEKCLQTLPEDLSELQLKCNYSCSVSFID